MGFRGSLVQIQSSRPVKTKRERVGCSTHPLSLIGLLRAGKHPKAATLRPDGDEDHFNWFGSAEACLRGCFQKLFAAVGFVFRLRRCQAPKALDVALPRLRAFGAFRPALEKHARPRDKIFLETAPSRSSPPGPFSIGLASRAPWGGVRAAMWGP